MTPAPATPFEELAATVAQLGERLRVAEAQILILRPCPHFRFEMPHEWTEAGGRIRCVRCGCLRYPEVQ